MKHLKAIWQLWGKYFMSLMRKTGMQMIIGSLFFALGAGFVMSKQTDLTFTIFQDNAAAVFALIAACSLCMAMAELAAELITDDKEEKAESQLEHVLKEKEAA
jgi:hypothetical protein